jgi:hypothetical protein
MMEDTAIVATDRMFHGITAYPSKYDYNYEYSHTHHTNNATQRALYTHQSSPPVMSSLVLTSTASNFV